MTVLADRFAPNVTSVVAGALWEWPPAVCGHHQDPISLARSRGWSQTSLRIFTDLAHDSSTGVFLRPVTFYFRQPIESEAREYEKLNELRGRVQRFRHDRALISENHVNPAIGLMDAYTYLAPMIDTDRYMQWLWNQTHVLGCRFVERKIAGTLQDRAETLLSEFQAEILVNCSGLGAADLATDLVRPLRGALVRLRNDGKNTARIMEAHCVSQTGLNDEDGFVFILPRGDDMVVLGGFAQLDEWDLDINLRNYEPIRAMYERCVEFLPSLRELESDAAEPVRVGLRPFRSKNVRLEQEPGTRTIHNYGHGGSGVTFSWGCSLEIADLIQTRLGTLGALPTVSRESQTA